MTSITEVLPGMPFSENLPSVPNLAHADENQWMQFFYNLLAVPKQAIHSKNPWMPNFLERASVPKAVQNAQERLPHQELLNLVIYSKRIERDTERCD